MPERTDMAENDCSTTLIEAAFGYARKGWPVFPLKPGKKEPLGGGRGFKDASTSLTAVADWWTGNPDRNIGFAIPDSIVVMDVDPRNGGLEAVARLQDDHSFIEPTLCAASGRGDGGLHYYFQAPDVHLVGNLGNAGYAGIDLKKVGGYVVLPPSIHPDSGRPYRWVNDWQPVEPMPSWLALLAEKPVIHQPAAVARVGPVDSAVELLGAPNPERWNGDGLVAKLADARPGERNNMLNWALWRLRDDLLAGKVSDALLQNCLVNIIDTANQIGLNDSEITNTIRSAFQSGGTTIKVKETK